MPRYKICCFTAIAAVLLFLTPLAPAQATVDSYIVVEAKSGTVLNAQNPDLPLFPASMTKIMTLYLTFEALQQGRLSMHTLLPVSDHAASMSPTKLGLHPGQTITVENAVLGAVTESANDAAVVLAEGIAGSEDKFAEMMTSRARALGMSNTRFQNANGLPDDDQITTARDMATLAQAMIDRFPKYYPLFATRSFYYGGRNHPNHNHLMSCYPGMDGIKTGFIRASGFNLTASAIRNHHRLIAIVFGGSSPVSRDNFMAELLDDGFRRVQGEPILAQTEAAAVTARIESTAAGATPPGQVSASIEGIDLSEAANAAPVMEQDSEGDAELPDPAPLPKQKAILVATPNKVSIKKPKFWNVQIGTFTKKRDGLAAAQRAVGQLPQALRGQAKPLAVSLRLRHREVYRAEIAGFAQQADAKRACLSLTHCTVLNPS